MKALSLSLAAISGAGFLFHNQLQSLTSRGPHGLPGSVQHHEAPEGVYYLRTAYTFPAPGGTVRWSPGQELRTAADTLATNGMVTLTDGQNSTPVPETAVTRDMDDASALRQLEAASQNAGRPQTVQSSGPERLVAGQFHRTSLDAPTVRTNRPENIVSTAGAPVIYSTSSTVIIERTARPPRTGGSETIVKQQPPRPQHLGNQPPQPLLRGTGN